MKQELEKKIKTLVEGCDLELYLVDDIVEEIMEVNSELINEGFLDILKKFSGFGWNILKGGAVDVVLGKYGKSYGSSFSKLVRDSKRKKGKKIDPNKNADDLLIWAGSQGHVLECVKSLQTLLELIKKLPAPIPDPEDKMTIRKWQKNGEFIKLIETVYKQHVSSVIASSKTIAEKKPKIKEFEKVLGEINKLSKDGGIVGGLSAIKIFCDQISGGSWAKAMKGAEKVSKKRKWFKATGNALPLEAMEIAKNISSSISPEINRLKEKMKLIKSKSGKALGGNKSLNKSPVSGVF